MFSSLFNVDNPVMKLLSRMIDIIVLDIMFVISCIPVVTIGAALSSLYYITVTGWDTADGHLFQKYVKSFKDNFIKSTVMWIVLLGTGSILAMGGYLILQQWKEKGSISLQPSGIIYLICLIVFAAIFTYVWPLQGKFENTIAATFKNALIMAVSNLPMTILLWLVAAGAAFLVYKVLFVRYMGTLFMFGLVAYLQGILFQKIFAPYLEQTRTTAEEE